MDPIKLKPEIIILYFLILFISVGLIARFYIPYLEPAKSDFVAGGSVTEKRKYSRVYALDKQSGLERWNFEDTNTLTQPVPDGESVYTGSRNGTLHALDEKTGMVRWRYETHGSIEYAPLVKNGSVIVAGIVKNPENQLPFMTKLFQVDPNSQSNIWKQTVPTSQQSDELVTLQAGLNYPPVQSGRYLAFSDLEGLIHVYDTTRGTTPLYVNTYQYQPRGNNDNRIEVAGSSVLLVASIEGLRVIPISDYIGPERVSKQIMLKILPPKLSKNTNYSHSGTDLIYSDPDFATRQVSIYRLDLITGSEKRVVTLANDQAVTFIKLDKNILVYQTTSSNQDSFDLHVFDLTIGRELWVSTYNVSCCQDVMKIENNVLYYTYAGMYLRAVQLQTGKEVWVTTVDGAITSDLMFDESRIYFSSGNEIKAIDKSTGIEIWRYQVKERSINSAITIGRENVFFVSTED
jgi:outer membrane protein assembly factor BamB